MMFRNQKIIYLQLSGRLGNQLFQLSYAHELARMFSCEVQPFFDSFHRPTSETSDLVTGGFQCAHVRPAIESNWMGNIVRLCDKLGVYFNRYRISSLVSFLGIHRQVDSHFPGPVFRRQPWLVTGFFIDQKYANKHQEVVASEITSLLKSHCIGSSVMQKIENLGEYQMMHIRRGDFVNNGANFGLLSLNYYLSNRTDHPLVVAIENEIEVSNFATALKPDIILTKENSTVWETLLAISKANDVVLSNSTFAWWGGFLASLNGSVVRFPVPFYLHQDNLNKYLNFRYFSPVQSLFDNDER